jgi:hypothetical protein
VCDFPVIYRLRRLSHRTRFPMVKMCVKISQTVSPTSVVCECRTRFCPKFPCAMFRARDGPFCETLPYKRGLAISRPHHTPHNSRHFLFCACWLYQKTDLFGANTGDVLNRRCDVHPHRRRAASVTSRLVHRRMWRCTASRSSRYRRRRCSLAKQVVKSIVRLS